MEETQSGDEEISIDFGKIKNWFKKKNKQEEVKEIEKEAEKTEEELNKISKEKPRELKEDKKEFKKVYQELQEEKKEATKIDVEEKKFEKKIEETKKELKEVEKNIEEEEISIDFGKIKKFFKPKEQPQPIKKEKEHSKESEEDEVSIDFSKIKKLFSSKEKTPAKKVTKEEQKESEELSFDFSKIKNIFKSSSKKEVTREESEEEASVDIKKITTFAKKYYVVFLLLIPIILSTYLRVMPAYLPVTDEWARNSVYNYFKSQIRLEIDKQYPNLPDDSKNNLVETEFQKMLKEQRATIEEQIKGTSNYFKSKLQDENGQTYLLELDPYFWMMHAQNILENGHPGDELRNRKTRELCYEWTGDCVPWDSHMYAPKGREATSDQFHPYFEVFIYKIVHFFNKDIPLKQVIFYIPVIIVALAIIPAFFIVQRIAGNFGGIIAGVIVAMNPSLLTRTVAGFSDTDGYNVFFPLLITWLFLIAFETKNTKSRLLCSALAGFAIGLYSFAWTGWWYIFDFLMGAAAMYILYYSIIHIKELKKGIIHFIMTPAIKNTILVIVLFFTCSAAATIIFQDYTTFIQFLSGPFEFATLKTIGIDSVWPNVYTTVAEQNPGSFDQVITTMGGKFLFIIGLLGILLTIIRKDVHGKIDVKYVIILTIWLIATIYASIKGVRYMLMILPAFSIAFGVAFGLIYSYVSQWVAKELKINITLSKIIIICLLCVLLINPFRTAKATATYEFPSMNDEWYASLDKINKNATKDAIINSWWDMGHWFKAIGNRSVTFDGTSQNTPMAHWIGNALLTDNEDVAVGILRMLDCGSNDAFEELDEVLNDTEESVHLLYNIIVLDKEDAANILKKYISLQGRKLSNDKIDKVLSKTHCDPPEDYFITSDDMIGKSGVWAHFGSWNFDKALIYNKLRNKPYLNNKGLSLSFLEQRFNYTSEEAESVYYEVESITSNDEANTWIAPWPSYASGVAGCESQGDNQTIRCNMGQFFIDVNLTTMEAKIPAPQGILHPNSLVYPTKEGIKVKEFNNTIGLSMVLLPLEDGNYNTILMSPQLAQSMFTRLYFMEGHGLTHFKLFSYERSVTGNEIYVWNVDWEGKEKNIMDIFKPNEINETKKEENTSKIKVEIE